MMDYIAWLDGHSVARGTLSHCRDKARAVFNSECWRLVETKPHATLRITRGARQSFVESIILHRERQS